MNRRLSLLGVALTLLITALTSLIAFSIYSSWMVEQANRKSAEQTSVELERAEQAIAELKRVTQAIAELESAEQTSVSLHGTGAIAELKSAELKNATQAIAELESATQAIAIQVSAGAIAEQTSAKMKSAELESAKQAIAELERAVLKSAELEAASERMDYEKKETKKKRFLEESLNRLPAGEFFHTVPDKMTAATPILIEAGIAKKVSQQILDELEIKGFVHTRKNVKYNPMGVEVRLDVDKEAFKVRDISTGVKPVVLGFPDQWMWEVTPLKRGKSTITILAVVELKVPGIDKSHKKETIVFKEERDIQVNLGYSSSKFASSYWKEASGLVFGSGSLVWFLKWLIDRRKEQLESQADKKPSPVGFGSFLNQQQGKDGK